jgi:hypothetical protein
LIIEYPIKVALPQSWWVSRHFWIRIKIAAVATNGCVESLPVAGAYRLDIYEPNFTIDAFCATTVNTKNNGIADTP